MKRIIQVSFGSDRRGATTTVNHILALGMTSLLVLGLLIGANTLITDQSADATRESLDTVGNQLADKIMAVDQLSTESANATLWVTQPEQVAGSGYSARIEHGPECNTPRISSDTCLVLTAAGVDVTRKIPVTNQTDVSITQVGSGRYKVTAERSGVDSGIRPTQPVEVPESTMRHGIGRSVSKDAVGATGNAGFNIPPTDITIRADIENPSTAYPVTFTASANDPDGDDSELEYNWNLGDGGATGTGKQTTHKYDTPGVYEVSLTVTDEQGATTTETFDISIAGLEYNGDLEESCTPSCTERTLNFSLQNGWNEGSIDNTVEITGMYINVVSGVESDPTVPAPSNVDAEVDYRDNRSANNWTLQVKPDDPADITWRFSYEYPLKPNGTVLPYTSSISRHTERSVESWMASSPATISSTKDAAVVIRGYSNTLVGEKVRVVVKHRINGRTNTTEFTDTVTATSP